LAELFQQRKGGRFLRHSVQLSESETRNSKNKN